MNKMSRAIVKGRILILILAVLLLIPAAIGYIKTRTNYDVLTYLPKDIETMKGQDILANDFGTGAFSLVVVENMKDKDIVKMVDQMETVDHVKKVVWYGSLMDITVPEELLPENLQEEISSGDAKLMAVIYDTTLSADETMNAVEELRGIIGKNAFLSGMSAVVVDTKNLSNKEVPVYVGLAVLLCFVVLTLTMDSFLIPVFFLLSIGFAVVYNLGSNFIQGEISYVTKALAAVLQLAVTMDYSIFLWHSYCAEQKNYDNHLDAMAAAISETFSSVVGSSTTTVAGFIALMFMSFTLGLDLGVVMAKGVVIGVISCVTILPSMILVFDKAIKKTTHKPIIPDFGNISKFIVKNFWIGLVLFAILIVPAFIGQRAYTSTKYTKTRSGKDAVYYNLDSSLPENLASIQANKKLQEKFNMNSTHMVLVSSDMEVKTVKSMMDEISEVKGVKKVLGMDSLVGPAMPRDMIPQDIQDIFDDGEYQMFLVMSEYKVASDEVNAQCDTINDIVKSYDEDGMLIGEAPCTKDLINITNSDFNTVNSVSILLVAIIIIFVFKSISLPILLVAVIEFAIFINMGIPYYTNTTLPFIASIVIGTIQLGSTVDYAILMTNKYKSHRFVGEDKVTAVTNALKDSISSIFVSAMTFFAATFGVGLYSDIDMISSLCILLARGAIVSMFVVVLLLPAVLRVFDPIIIHTSLGFRDKTKKEHKAQMSN